MTNVELYACIASAVGYALGHFIGFARGRDRGKLEAAIEILSSLGKPKPDAPTPPGEPW